MVCLLSWDIVPSTFRVCGSGFAVRPFGSRAANSLDLLQDSDLLRGRVDTQMQTNRNHKKQSS